MKALITTGIGDFLALETVLREDEQPDTILWATRAEASIRQLIPFCFPRVREQHTLFSNFTGPHTPLFCFGSKEEVWERVHPPFDIDGVADLNVRLIGAEFKAGKRKFRGSSLLQHSLADISRFKLPTRYCVIHPHSQNVREPKRDLSATEWTRLREWLRQVNLPGVVINQSNEVPPAGFLNLTNQTSLLEALEIVKGASGFVGCSSVFSVLAGQVVPPNRFFVKGHSVLRNEWQDFYYPEAPGRVFEELTFEAAGVLIGKCLCGESAAEREERHGLPMLRCSACGAMRQDVAMTTRDYGEWYRDRYFDGVYTHTDSHDREVAKARLEAYGLPKRVTLLDVGCGTGAFVEEAAARGIDAWGQDLAHQADSPRVYVGELRDVRFPTGHFDVVTMHDVLEHVPEPRAFLGEVRRILKPGGRLILDFPRFHHESGAHHWKPVEHLWMLDDGEVATLLGSEGFLPQRLAHPVESKSVFYAKAVEQERSVRVLVPAGIGDGYWVMVKLQGWMKQRGITLPEIWVDDGGPHRSEGFWRRVPFVRWGGYAKINAEAKRRAYTTSGFVVQEGVDGFDYFISFNGSMDSGVSLDKAMPGPVDWYAPLFTPKSEAVLIDQYKKQWGNYVVAAFWDHGIYQSWIKDFSEASILATLRGLADSGKRVVVMGAEWDKQGIAPRLAAGDKRFVNLVGGTSFDELVALVKGAAGVIGFPAGNTMLGPYLKRPTLLMWNHKFPQPFWTNCVPPDAPAYVPLGLTPNTTPERVLRSMLSLVGGEMPPMLPIPQALPSAPKVHVDERWSKVTEQAEVVAIVATGPSLRDVDLHFHPGIKVIAVNGAWGHVPADFWFTLDCSTSNRAIMEQALQHPETTFYAAVEEYYGTQTAPSMHLRKPPERGVKYLRRFRGHGPRGGNNGLSSDPTGVNTGNSAYGALGLAYLMGAKRIALLGVDGRSAEGYAWGPGRPSGLGHLGALFCSAARQLKEAGVQVVVGSPQSIVQCWPRCKPQEALDWLVQLLNISPPQKPDPVKKAIPSGISQPLIRRGALTPSDASRRLRTGSARRGPATPFRLPNAADAKGKGDDGLGSGHSPGQPVSGRPAGEPNMGK